MQRYICLPDRSSLGSGTGIAASGKRVFLPQRWSDGPLGVGTLSECLTKPAFNVPHLPTFGNLPKADSSQVYITFRECQSLLLVPHDTVYIVLPFCSTAESIPREWSLRLLSYVNFVAASPLNLFQALVATSTPPLIRLISQASNVGCAGTSLLFGNTRGRIDVRPSPSGLVKIGRVSRWVS
jgi:hypothetical protein